MLKLNMVRMEVLIPALYLIPLLKRTTETKYLIVLFFFPLTRSVSSTTDFRILELDVVWGFATQILSLHR